MYVIRPKLFRRVFIILLISTFLPYSAFAQADQGMDVLYRRAVQDTLQGKPLVIHITVALCDNRVIFCGNERLGNGDNLSTNLYWGAMFGYYQMFMKSKEWEKVYESTINDTILRRVVFRRTVAPNKFWKDQGIKNNFEVYVVLDAYRGMDIKKAVEDYFRYLYTDESLAITFGEKQIIAGGQSHIIGYAGHDYLMGVDEWPFSEIERKGNLTRGTFVLACLSEHYFKERIAGDNTHILLLTRSLMAPEAYTALALIEAFLKGENYQGILDASARAYAQYQKISGKAALKVFTNGN